MKRLAPFVSVVLAALWGGCSPTTGPGTCPNPCGTECCAEGTSCNSNTSKCEAACTPACNGRQCGSDGCGGSCGTCGSGTVCDTASGTCVGCTTNTDCGTAGVCLTSEKRCVECLVNQDCPAGEQCDTDHTCYGCKADADCAGDPAKPKCSPTLRQCVACVTNAECSGATPICDPSVGTCVGCVSDGDCTTKGVGQCDPADKTCKQCLGDADCSGATCSSNSCSGAPANDTCANLFPLTFENGVAKVWGDLSQAKGDVVGACPFFPFYGKDRAYSFTLTHVSDVEIRMNALQSGFKPAMALRYVCDDQAEEFSCSADPSGKGYAAIKEEGLQPGTYYVWADALDASTGGAFELIVKATERTPAPNDVCANAIPLTFDSSGVATVTGSTVYARNDTSGSCAGESSGDVVYSFTLTGDASVRATVTPPASTADWPVAVYIRKACDDATTANEVRCASTLGSGTGTATSYSLPAGTYYVWVDGDSSIGANIRGEFTLTVTQGPPQNAPTNDDCSSPKQLTFVNDVATESGSTRLAADDLAVSPCGGTATADVVYTFTTNAPQKFVAEVTPKTAGYQPIVYLRNQTAGCTGANSGAMTCDQSLNSSSLARIQVNSLPAGTYYLWVDGYRFASPNSGSFDLKVTLAPPQANAINDSCASPATPLTFIGDTATVSSSTVGVVDNTRGTCNFFTDPPTNPDVVYSFTTGPGAQSVTAEVIPASPTYIPVVYVRSACDTPGVANEHLCSNAGVQAGTAKVVIPSLPAGTYYVWVDGYSYKTYLDGRGQGDFTLNVTKSAPLPPPANDTCGGAISLSKGSKQSGTTVAASKDYGDGTMSPDCTTQPDGPDVVYSYAPTTTGNFKILLTTPPNFNASLWVTTGICGDEASCVKDANVLGGGKTEQLTVAGTAGTTYYIIVDSEENSSGTFNIEVQ